MKVKYFSEVLNKYYDSEEEVLEAEKEFVPSEYVLSNSKRRELKLLRIKKNLREFLKVRTYFKNWNLIQQKK